MKQVRLTGRPMTLEQKRFQDLLNGPHFEFDSRSFHYSMPKKGSSGVIGERNSMLSNDMKYKFNKIFPLLTK